MKSISRRHYLGLSLGAAMSASVARSESAGADKITAFIEKYNVPGLSFAIAKDGVIVRREAFGFASLAKEKEKLNTAHRFRIASVSKPITATTIFLLVEHGKLKLDDLVFGKGGHLDFPGPAEITVRHLLTHTSGGWTNDAHDPMFKKIGWDHEQLIPWALSTYPPKNPPGNSYAYSNFGYCLLGRVIEKLSGQSYEAFVRKNVLEPSNAGGMSVGKADREVKYYTDGKPEGYKMNIARMDAHGGWVGSPSEMLKFALRADGFPKPADLLEEGSLATMTKRDGVNEGYACGWGVNKVGNYWHGGSLPGLSSLLVRTASGYCWAACANTRAKGINLGLDRLMWDLVRG